MLNAHDSFSKDLDLSSDPNIPNSFLPSYNPELGTQKTNDAYFPEPVNKIKDTKSQRYIHAQSQEHIAQLNIGK